MPGKNLASTAVNNGGIFFHRGFDVDKGKKLL